MTGPSLYILAHQDDEYGCIAQIRREVAEGQRVAVVYLTDGTSNVDEPVRTAESRAVLAFLGVAPDDISVLGASFGIVCLELPARLEEIYEALLALLRRQGLDRPARVTTLAWEGGNPDHDAAHLAAVRLARELGVPELLEVALYNAFRRVGPFFRVMSFCDGARVGADAGPRLTLRQALRDAFVCWRYPSQRTTWIGLFPGSFVRLMLRRRHAVRRVAVERSTHRPHAGALYYERRWNFPYERFAALTRSFAAGTPAGRP